MREAFDVPACNFCILAKLLEESPVDKYELKHFQNLVRYDYIYKRIAEHAGIEFNELNKKEIKTSCQHWLNIRKCKLHTGSWNDKYFDYIDKFFKYNYPTIYNALINWREEKYVSSAGTEKTSKMLWWDFQKVEYDIISNKMCDYLYQRFNVTPVTVHDALYLTDADLEKVKQPIEDIFWNLIDFQYLDYVDITFKENVKHKENDRLSIDDVISTLDNLIDDEDKNLSFKEKIRKLRKLKKARTSIDLTPEAEEQLLQDL